VIFVSVGNQLPFDRLVHAVDRWASANSDVQVIAQVGELGLPPKHCQSVCTVDAVRYQELMANATHVVAHAGMGTVLTALRLGKPLLVMPRQSGRGEVRSDHQQSTCRYLEGLPGVTVAWDETELVTALPAFLEQQGVGSPLGDPSRELLSIRRFVHEFVHADRREER
jgi:UDP-N-acetylglucosamine transferase subunit ALG13